MTISTHRSTLKKLHYTKIVPSIRPTVKKPTFIFIHGLGSSGNFYFPIAYKLSEDQQYECILLDNFGAGRSPVETILEHGSVRSMALDVLEVANDNNLSNEPIILVGHSMGGMIVNYAASHFAKDETTLLDDLTKFQLNLQKIVILGPLHPTPKISELFAKRFELLSNTRSLDELANAIPFLATGSKCSLLKKSFIRELIIGSDVDGYKTNCKVIQDAGLTFTTTDLIGFYKTIYVPTLLLQGEQDTTSPWDNGGELIAKNIANCTVAKLPGVGHWYCIEDDESIYKLISDFAKL